MERGKMSDVERQETRGMITLRGDLGSEALRGALRQICGLDVPGVRRVSFGAGIAAVWMSPDELLITCAYDRAAELVAAFDAAMKGQHFLSVNVSDARAVFTLPTQRARETIAKGAPVDMSADAFGVGDVRRSRLGQVAAAFWMREDAAIELVCFRSVSDFVEAWLTTAAAPGAVVGYFNSDSQ
jgi:sarcosine oxidase subunit gamma